jgi:hypothetical protein
MAIEKVYIQSNTSILQVLPDHVAPLGLAVSPLHALRHRMRFWRTDSA